MLGRAYSSQDEKLRRDNIYACVSNEGMPDTHHGPCAMGVDNDDGKHVVIGFRTGSEKYRLLRIFSFDDKLVNNFHPVLDLIPRFHIKSCVADLRPNADSAREFQKAAIKLGCKVYLCEYTESPLQDYAYNDNNGIVKVYRTGIFDASHRVFMNQDIVLPYRTKTLDEFAEQCCNCVKSKEVDKRKRIVIYRYKKTGSGNDHYRNAFNYFLVAANKVSRIMPKGYSRQTVCINESVL